MAKRKGVILVTPKFRLSYPAIFEPKYNSLSEKNEYSCVALFAKGEDLSEIKDTLKKLAVEAWGENAKKWPKNWKNPLKLQDVNEIEDEDTGEKRMPDGQVKGAFFINMKSKNAPGVIDQKKKPILDAEEFYAGCYARAEVYVSVFEIKKENSVISTGISFSLNHLQKMAEGDPLSGRKKAEQAFSAIDMPEEEEVKPVEDEEENPFG